ncbi:MAG: hypothetical protein AAFW70_20530 [Cyanobacteria bacterium J06635_10]
MKNNLPSTTIKRRFERKSRSAEVVWNIYGDLNPNPILSPLSGGELNPYV